jgi:hypothetical protein
MLRPTAALLIATLSTAAGGQPTCPMVPSFNQLDRGGTRSIAVWRAPGGGPLLFADAMNINTDGTRRSYSVDDFWGERNALNNLCNAMSDACAGLNSDQLRARRIITQSAKARGWPADLLRQTKLSPSIIPVVNGRPCPEVGGYLVSATSLQNPGIANVCDIRRYADALKINAVVLPKRARTGIPTDFQQRGAEVGDLAVALSANGNVLSYSVVGDTGPAKELGEVSVALAQRLTGRPVPTNYQEIRGRGHFRGHAWSVGRTFVLIFPNSRNALQPYMTQERIDAAASQKLEQWGGAKRLRACATKYGQ